jgi:hydroxyacylglutathione hydrolase/adenylyltransferase/sulfurtransferase
VEIDLAPEDVRRRHEAGDIALVDVREPYERDAGHIDGSRHIALGALASEAQSLDPQRPVVFYCRVGGRSRMAAMAFRRAGFDAYSMDGGLVAWDAQNLPLVPEGGHVADH